jgi:hypothetical protein
MMTLIGKKILAILGCFLGLALVLAFAFAFGKISPRLLGVGLVSLVASLTVAVSLLFRNERSTQDMNREQSRLELKPSSASSARKLKAIVIFLVAALIVGIFATKGQPVLPRFIGAAVNLFFVGWCITLLRRVNRSPK